MLKILLIFLSSATILALGYIILNKNYFSVPVSVNSVKDSRMSIVEATFILSPAKPVCGIGENDCSAPMKNFPVDVFRQGNNVKYYSGKTDENGKLAAILSPGDYYFVYDAGPEGGEIRKNFTVKAGETVKLQITVDTGIR